MKKLFFLVFVLMAAAGSWAVIHAWPPTKAKTETAPAPPQTASSANAGLKVHVDPVTGRVVPPPANVAPSPAEKEMFKSSHEGLIEEPGTTAAGGFKVDALGRFRSAATVSIGGDGKPVINCVETNAVQPLPR